MPTYQIETVTSPAPLSARFYWPPDSKVKAWLEPNWDAWVAAPPPWFTPYFMKLVTKEASPEVLPLTVLRELAEKHSKGGQGGGSRQTESEVGSEQDGSQLPTYEAGNDPDTLRLSNSSDKQQSHRFENTSREELVRMETERRANKAFARAKQLWIWTAALAFSYVDLVTTVVVGLQYLDMGTAQGTNAAHVTFAMLGLSSGVQAMFTHLTGTHRVSSPCIIELFKEINRR